jgi:hypothetical protein
MFLYSVGQVRESHRIGRGSFRLPRCGRTRDARAEGYLRSQLDVAGLVLRALISEGVERLELKKA